VRIAFLILLSCVSCLPAFGAKGVFVSDPAAGLANGTSWANAYSYTNITWANVDGGDTLYLDGGSGDSKVYTSAGAYFDIDTFRMFNVTKAGSAGSKILITVTNESGHNGRVIFNANHFIGTTGRRGDAVTLNSYNILDGGPLTNIWILNNTNQMAKDHNAGIFLGGAVDTTVMRVGVSNCNSGLSANGGAGLQVYSNSFIYIIAEAGVSMGGGVLAWDTNRVHHNTVVVIQNYDKSSGADGIKPGTGASVYDNDLKLLSGYGYVNPGQHPDAFQCSSATNTTTGSFSKYYNNRVKGFYNAILEMGWGAHPSNIMVFNNEVHFEDTNIPPAYIGGFVSEDSGAESIRNIFIFNNTFADMVGGNVFLAIHWDKGRYHGPPDTALPLYFPTMTNVFICNNIFYNCSTPIHPVIHLGDYVNTNWSASNLACIVVANNLLYAGATGGTNVIVGTNHTASEGLHFQGHINQVVGDPLFANLPAPYTTNASLRLLAGSPALNTGTNLTLVISNYAGLTGLRDMDGNAHPLYGDPSIAANRWNVGAFQSVSSGGGDPPPSATGTGNRKIRGVRIKL